MSKPKTVTLGLLQHACVADSKANLKKNLSLVAQAAKQGAQIICTQEMVTSQYFCQSEEHRFFDLAEPNAQPPIDPSSWLRTRSKLVGSEARPLLSDRPSVLTLS